MKYVHRKILQAEGHRYLTQIWYDFDLSGSPFLVKVEVFNVDENAVIGEQISSMEGDEINMAARCAAASILINDGVFDAL